MIIAYTIDKKMMIIIMWEKQIAKLQEKRNKKEKVLKVTITMSDEY